MNWASFHINVGNPACFPISKVSWELCNKERGDSGYLSGWMPPPGHISFCPLLSILLCEVSLLLQSPKHTFTQGGCLRKQIPPEGLRELQAITGHQGKILNQTLDMIFLQDYALRGRICSLGACSLVETDFISLSRSLSGTTHFLPLEKLWENSWTSLHRPVYLSPF